MNKSCFLHKTIWPSGNIWHKAPNQDALAQTARTKGRLIRHHKTVRFGSPIVQTILWRESNLLNSFDQLREVDSGPIKSSDRSLLARIPTSRSKQSIEEMSRQSFPFASVLSDSTAAAAAASAMVASRTQGTGSSGLSSSFSESAWSITLEERVAVADLESFMGMIPPELKIEYTEATVLCPQLVATESHPIKFLRRERYNAWEAALKLALYWKVRKDVYGAQRCFQPLSNLDGNNGALNDRDLIILQTGFLVSLPPSGVDGRPTIFCDTSRLQATIDVGLAGADVAVSCVRCVFYMAHILSETVAGQSKGCRLMCLLRKSDVTRLASFRLQFEQLVKGLAVGVHNAYIIQSPEWGHELAFMTQGAAQVQVLAGNIMVNSPEAVSGTTPAQLASKLQFLGFSRNGLPSSLGGLWSYENFREQLIRAGLPVRGSRSPLSVAALARSEAELAFVNGGVAASRLSAHNAPLPLSTSLLESVRSGVMLHPSFRSSDAPAPVQGGLLARKDGSQFAGPSQIRTTASQLDTKQCAKRRRMSSPSKDSVESFVETPVVEEKGLLALEEALAMISDDDKAALMEARVRIPELAEKEAPPIRFLRAEDFDPWAAARRLVNYWATRKEFFEDRAFLPMNQSGEGTLSRDDVTVLRSGYITILPNDNAGRPVICGHPSRRKNHAPLPRLRLAFYMFSIICECKKTQEEGCVIISVLQRPSLDRTVREAATRLLQSLPIKVYRMHIIHPPRVERETFLGSLVPLCLKLFGKYLEHRASVHVADSREELFEKLAKHGLTEDSLPEDVGGSWKYSAFLQWLELRMCAEWELPVVGARNEQNFPCIPSYHAKPRSDLTEEEKVERKRRLNVLHSRRKRERSRVEKEVLQEQATELQDENDRLLKEKEELENLLRRAEGVVSKIEG